LGGCGASSRGREKTNKLRPNLQNYKRGIVKKSFVKREKKGKIRKRVMRDLSLDEPSLLNPRKHLLSTIFMGARGGVRKPEKGETNKLYNFYIW